MSIGDLGPLLPYLLNKGALNKGARDQDDCSGTGDGTLPTSFQTYLESLVGERVKIYIRFQTLVAGPPVHNPVIIARVVAVDGDYLIIEDIVVNGDPLVDPRRLFLQISEIIGVERLSERQILFEALLGLP